MTELKKIVVWGGTGFVGTHLVNHLVETGWRVTVPTRRRECGQHLLPLPSVDVVEFSPLDKASYGQLLQGATATVNLVGILNERSQGEFFKIHVDHVKTLIAACQHVGVERLIHLSALGASAQGPSQYLRSKWLAEEAVRQSHLAWTILRPSVIFGPEDCFLNRFADLLRYLPIFPLAKATAQLQPIYVGDAAHALFKSLTLRKTIRQTYVLAGPKIYSLRELVELVVDTLGWRRWIIALPDSLATLQAYLLERLPGRLLSRDNLASLEVPNISTDPFPAIFGIIPTALSDIAPQCLRRSRNLTDAYAKYRQHRLNSHPL